MSDVSLVDTKEGKALSAELPTGRATLVVDFARGPWARRVKNPRAAHVVAACGKPPQTVLDCTCGFARDALALAAAGFDVVACERAPLMFAVVDDAHRRATLDTSLAPIVARLSLVHGDAANLLAECARGARAPFDVVVIDPMFDEDTHGSAQVKKDMQLARALVSPNPDDGRALVEAARAVAVRRVIVKRPRGSAPLVDGVSFAKETRAARLDVYVR